MERNHHEYLNLTVWNCTAKDSPFGVVPILVRQTNKHNNKLDKNQPRNARRVYIFILIMCLYMDCKMEGVELCD